MSASLQFFDSDGVTVVTTVSLGNIPTPGTSAPRKLFLNNAGNQTAQNATVAIEAIGTNDGSTYAQTAPDVSGSPGTFGTSTLNLGNIAVSASVPFWVQSVLISGLTADGNPRRYTLLGSAQTL